MTTLTPEEIKALKRANVYTYYDENAGHSTLTVDEFIGKLTGNADTATRFKDPCILSLTGDASGMVQIYGSEYKDLNVTVTHADEANHAQRADVATLTNRCSLADIANLANFSLLTRSAEVANRSLVADNAITANDATHADSADTATSASRATYDAVGNNIASTFSNHDGRITANATKNTKQDTRLNNLENYTEFKDWSSTTTYSKDKIVVYEDNLYRSKVNNNLNHLPTEQNSAYWKLLSETASGGTADCVHINNTETVLGDKTFTGLLIATTQEQSDNSTKVATTSFVHSAVNTLATNVYTKSETYSKSETNDLVTPKADNDSVVHLADAETITGIKTFSSEVYVPTAESSDNSTKVASTAFVKGVFEKVVDKIYPVGSIYISVNSTSPSILFGGEWEQIQEKFLLSAGETHTAGTTGGEFTHTLTTAEMPTHNHSASSNSTGAHTHTRGTMEIYGAWERFWCEYNGTKGAVKVTREEVGWLGHDILNTNACADFYASRHWSGATSSNGDHSHTITVNNNGSGNAHNNTPPYLAVYMWKRVA